MVLFGEVCSCFSAFFTAINKSARGALCLGLLCTATVCFGEGDQAFITNVDGSPTERKLLPEYCNFTHPMNLFKKGTGEYTEGGKKWMAIHGESNQKHIHHYCWAMVRLLRSHSLQASAQMRKHLRETALADIDYSIEFSTPDFRLLPELFAKRGTTLRLLGRDKEALESFRRAIELNQKNVFAHYELVDLLKMHGKSAEAKEALANALRENPDAPALRQMQARLN